MIHNISYNIDICIDNNIVDVLHNFKTIRLDFFFIWSLTDFVVNTSLLNLRNNNNCVILNNYTSVDDATVYKQ